MKCKRVDLAALLPATTQSNAIGIQTIRHSAPCPLCELSIQHSGHSAFQVFGFPVLFSFGIQTFRHSAAYTNPNHNPIPTYPDKPTEPYQTIRTLTDM